MTSKLKKPQPLDYTSIWRAIATFNRIVIVLLLVLWGFFLSHAAVAQSDSLRLYPDGVPGATPSDVKETTRINPQDGVAVTTNVRDPILYVHEPERPNGTGVIICPGGGYYVLAMEHEGHAIARWFAERGVTAFVLKSRLPNDALMTQKAIRPLQDVQQAMRLVRDQARRWDVQPDRIGVMGFSAGGHLAASLSTHFDHPVGQEAGASPRLRPDFSVLVYPALQPTESATLDSTFTLEALLGEAPSDSMKAFFSLVQQVDGTTPPTWLVHASDDAVVDPGGSVDYYLALRRHGIPAELHLYETGGHGFSLAFKERGSVSTWDRQLQGWLETHGLMSQSE
jgi:acetyl esterase/lipase